MNTAQRIWIVVLAALRGWLCATSLRFLLGLTSAARSARQHGFPFRWSYVFNDGSAFWAFCTFLVTAIVTLVLIVPLFAALPWRILVRRPWLVTVAPLLLVLPVSFALSSGLEAPMDSFSAAYSQYGDFALLTCTLSSTFVLSDLQQWRRRHPA